MTAVEPGVVLEVVQAVQILPPCGRRRLSVAVVRCTWCGGLHLHRGRQLDGAVRVAGCSGRAYMLAVSK